MTAQERRQPRTPKTRTPDVNGVSQTGTARDISARKQPAHPAKQSEMLQHRGAGPAVESSDTTPGPAKHKRSTATALTSYGDLLRALYGPVRRRWKPTHREIGEMQNGPKLNSSERAQLLDLAASDVTLKKTRDVMLFGMKRLDGPNGDRPVHCFVRDALRRHPAYQSKSLSAALEHANVPVDRRAVHVLTAEVQRLHERSELPKRQAYSCRANALHCFLLWHRENQSSALSLEETLSYLQEELWTSFAKRRTSELDKFRSLVGDRDPYATSIACSGFSQEILELRRELSASRARTRQLQVSLSERDGQLQEARDRLKERNR